MAHNPFYTIENPELIGYEYAWVSYFKNGEVQEQIIPAQILASWKRCQELQLDPTVRRCPEILCSPEDFKVRKKANTRLLESAQPILDGLINVLQEKNMDICIVDLDRVALQFVSHDAVNNRIGRERICFSEPSVGTNCLDLALRHQKPVSVIGAQHFFHHNHKYAGYAAPIVEGGAHCRGAIGVFVLLEHLSEYMLSVVVTAARAIENALDLLHSNESVFQQNHEKQEILDSVNDAILYVDRNQIITHVNQRFMQFTGLRKEKLIGKNIDVIRTAPHISSLVRESWTNQNDVRVRLQGKGKSYNCFLRHRIVQGQDGRESAIWIFTAMDAIRELVDRINVENRAFFSFDDIVGKSAAMAECIELAKKVADYDVRAIIVGESGTGKEVIAQSIHNRSLRKDGPFVAVDCGAIPRELLESELFGYEEGAYTGARKGGHRGKFESAHSGTLFLDEIGNLPLDMQAKLLRVLQDSRVMRIGGDKPIQIDVQVIAATNNDLRKDVEKGNFREDLFYRLNVVHIHLPPLRERREDIPLLVSHFLARSTSLSRRVRTVAPEVMEMFCRYSWPGNVRQLNNILERMAIFARNHTLTKDLIPDDITQDTHSPAPPVAIKTGGLDTLEAAQANYTYQALQALGGNIKKTAETLNVSRATVYRILKKSGYLS